MGRVDEIYTHYHICISTCNIINSALAKTTYLFLAKTEIKPIARYPNSAETESDLKVVI